MSLFVNIGISRFQYCYIANRHLNGNILKSYIGIFMEIPPKGFDFWQYLERLFVILFSANLIDNHSVNASSKFYICYFHRPISSCLHVFLH